MSLSICFSAHAQQRQTYDISSFIPPVGWQKRPPILRLPMFQPIARPEVGVGLPSIKVFQHGQFSRRFQPRLGSSYRQKLSRCGVAQTWGHTGRWLDFSSSSIKISIQWPRCGRYVNLRYWIWGNPQCSSAHEQWRIHSCCGSIFRKHEFAKTNRSTKQLGSKQLGSKSNYATCQTAT